MPSTINHEIQGYMNSDLALYFCFVICVNARYKLNLLSHAALLVSSGTARTNIFRGLVIPT